jgi:hypothetical protein
LIVKPAEKMAFFQLDHFFNDSWDLLENGRVDLLESFSVTLRRAVTLIMPVYYCKTGWQLSRSNV